MALGPLAEVHFRSAVHDVLTYNRGTGGGDVFLLAAVASPRHPGVARELWVPSGIISLPAVASTLACPRMRVYRAPYWLLDS